jgi:DNA repair photolyase
MHQKHMKKFTPIAVSSKFAICGLPIRVDTYKNCSHGCKYCFSNERVIMEFKKDLQVGNIESVKRKLDKVFSEKYNAENFLEYLIKDGITWHCGGMSDPFQPVEKSFGITKQLVDVTNSYGISILFSTKGFSTYDVDIRPDLHTLHFSFSSSTDRRDIEPFIATFEKRYKLYRTLKDRGFKCGIRVQPFIPGVTNIELVERFKDADYFTIEGLKLVPQNKEHKEYLLKLLKLNKEDFTQMGLLNLKPEIREKIYEPFIYELNKYSIPFSLADNDMHHISSGKCCCGDPLVNKSTDYNNTAMCFKYGPDYTKDNLISELGDCSQCVANNLFTSNRQEGCKTVGCFYEKRFDRKSSPFSPKFLYRE